MHINRIQSVENQTGLSLIELLVALVLSLAVLIALSYVYVAAKQAFRFQENTGRMQEDGAYALDLISREMRMAGHGGCAGIGRDASVIPNVYTPGLIWSNTAASIIQGLNPLEAVLPGDALITVQPFTPFNTLRGFDTGPNAMFATGNVPAWSTTSSSIFFAGASGQSAALSAPMALATSALTLNTNTFGWAGKNLSLIISDCTDSSLFNGAVTAVGAGPTAALNVAHGTTDGNGVANFRGSKIYGTSSVVMTAEWNFFYVATRTGATTPSLFRVRHNGENRLNAEEVISNVEAMKIHYGEANAATPEVVSNWRTTAAAVTDWSRVVAVRVGLMMISSDANNNTDLPAATIKLLGASYTIPTGQTNRSRREFSTTIVLRNRVAPR